MSRSKLTAKSLTVSRTSKAWKGIIEEGVGVEVSPERISDQIASGYQFDLHYVTGHLPLTSPEIYNTEYEVRLSLYDVLHRRFIGRTWRSHHVPSTKHDGKPEQIVLNQPVYFQTTMLDSSILLVVEIVSIQTPKNPMPDQPLLVKNHTLGWGVVRLFTSGHPLKDVSDGSEAQLRKMDVYQGSPRSLLYMEVNVERDPNIKLFTGCQVSYTFLRHAALDNIMHLIPENVIFGANQRLPGMSEHSSKHGGVKDYFQNPRVLKQRIGYIDKLTIDLGSPVDVFEEELCASTNDDRLRRSNTTDDGKHVTVSARRLMVGVHNGYRYVQNPQYVHVERESSVGGPRMSSIRGSKTSPRVPSSNNLVLRSRLELDEMIPDPRVAIVFQLEYILTVPSGGHVKDSRTSLHSQTSTVMVRWASWCPHEHASVPPQQAVAVGLHGGAAVNPDSMFFYKFLSEDDKGQGAIRFHYLITDEPIATSPASMPPEVQEEQKEELIIPVKSGSSLPAEPEPPKVDDSYKVEITHLEMEGEYPPVHVPPILPIAQGAPALTRATYARLFASGFPEIVDRKGSSPTIVDPNDSTYHLDLQKNINDPLQTNEICFQFLAFTNPVPGPFEAPPPNIQAIFLTFQFYRFQPVTTQRLALTRKTSAHGYHDTASPCVLRKIEAGEQLDEGQPGLEVKYHVDPTHMREGETASFLSYLSSHNLHMDVWDGESLLLLGSVVVPLKHLLRNCQSAVVVNHECDMTLSEHSDVSSTFTGDLSAGGSIRPLGVSKRHRGRLHIRVGNVGYPSQSKSARSLKRTALVVADLSGCSFSGGSISSALSNATQTHHNRCRAKRLVDVNSELSDLLLLNTNPSEHNNDKENVGSEAGKIVDADRRRKIMRMQAIRRVEDQDTSTPTIGRKALLSKQEKALKERDLVTISNYRDRLKPDHITEMLLLSITTRHTITPTLGVAEFIELQLKNPFPTQQTISIECDSPELRVVTDGREWRYFKGLAGLHTPVEENMFTFNDSSALPQIFLRSKETVYIPFRYQGYDADHTVTAQAPGHFLKATPTSLQPIRDHRNHGTIKPKMVKAILRTSDGRPLSVLQLVVSPQPHIVDQTFRFYNPEQAFLKKSIRLPPFRAAEQLHVVCSDPEIVCQARTLKHDEPCEIFIKAPCGESPSVRKFYLSLYNDSFLAVPVQTWQFFVHSLQRLDVNCVLGQTSRFSLVLKGTQASRMVQCFPSHINEMQVAPDQSFLLPANGVYEIAAGIRTHHSGSKYMYLNVVDVEYHQLIRTWLIAVKAREPLISKEFDIELPRSGGKSNNKQVSYTNSYPIRKKLHLMTNRADIVQFKYNTMELGPSEKSSIGLRFASGVALRGKVSVHIFINDDDDKNEETFLVHVTYV